MDSVEAAILFCLASGHASFQTHLPHRDAFTARAKTWRGRLLLCNKHMCLLYESYTRLERVQLELWFVYHVNATLHTKDMLVVPAICAGTAWFAANKSLVALAWGSQSQQLPANVAAPDQFCDRQCTWLGKEMSRGCK
jgi:hypothetical protein